MKVEGPRPPASALESDIQSLGLSARQVDLNLVIPVSWPRDDESVLSRRHRKSGRRIELRSRPDEPVIQIDRRVGRLDGQANPRTLALHLGAFAPRPRVGGRALFIPFDFPLAVPVAIVGVPLGSIEVARALPRFPVDLILVGHRFGYISSLRPEAPDSAGRS